MRNNYRLQPIVSPADRYTDPVDEFYGNEQIGNFINEQQEVESLLSGLNVANPQNPELQGVFESLLSNNGRISIEYECGACCKKVSNIASVFFVLGYVVVLPPLGGYLMVNGKRETVRAIAIPLDDIKSFALEPRRCRCF